MVVVGIMGLEVISLRTVSARSKIALLRELGYDTDGRRVLKDGVPVVDEVAGEEVTLENMAILPGSTVVMVDDPISIAAYFEEHGDPE